MGNKIKEIAEGWANVVLQNHNDIAELRLKICNSCEHHSKFHNTIRLDDHCTKCGCTLIAKARSMESKCPIGKWPNYKKQDEK